MSADYEIVKQRLKQVGIETFLEEPEHRIRLYAGTTNHDQMADAMGDARVAALIKAMPDDYEKSQKLYSFICQIADSDKFIMALSLTKNKHIINYIEDRLNKNVANSIGAAGLGVVDSNPAIMTPTREPAVLLKGAVFKEANAIIAAKEIKATLDATKLSLRDLLVPNIVYLCQNTTNFQGLAMALVARGVVSLNNLDGWNSMAGDFSKLSELYKLMMKKDCTEDLIFALGMSDNEHIIHKLKSSLTT